MESKYISRVKFYSINDLSIGSYIERIENIICNFDIEEKRADINEIIEFKNLKNLSINNLILYFYIILYPLCLIFLLKH